MSYAGMIAARGTTANHVMDDVFVNESFFRRWWPRSQFLTHEPAELL